MKSVLLITRDGPNGRNTIQIQQSRTSNRMRVVYYYSGKLEEKAKVNRKSERRETSAISI